MTTDEMILALVERHGFVLPGGLWRNEHGVWMTGDQPLQIVQARDLCACTFARTGRVPDPSHMGGLSDFDAAMCAGDSAAAIEALYEALAAQQPTAQADPATEPQR